MDNIFNEIELGMPTLIENKSLEESASLCRELGLRFVELNMNLPQYQAEKLSDYGQLREAAEKYGIYYTVHLDENLNVSDFNSRVTEAYLDTVKEVIHSALNLGVPVINMHMNTGVYFTLPDRRVYLFGQYREEYLRKLDHFRKMCEAEIGKAGLSICIENTDGYLPFQQEGAELLLGSKVFSLTWDIGHSHSAGDVDEAFIMQHEDRLKHFHIHDALGGKNHLTLGTGEIDLAGRLKVAARHGCRCVVETKTVAALRESAKWLNITIM